MNNIVFSLQDVHFSYLKRYPALCGVSVEIRKGEKAAFIGANGTGKSTLLQILDGLIFPDSGKAFAFGKELNENTFNDGEFSLFFRSKVGFVFQNPEVQLFSPTVEEDIIFGPLQFGVSTQEIKKRLEFLSESFKIRELLKRPPHYLSIGEKRKIAIATVLAIDPEVLIMDEPTAGLDPQTARQIIDIIVQANLEGRTIITATHDLHIVEEISDTVYVLDRNKQITTCGSPEEILSDGELLKNNNLIHIHKHRHKDKIHIHGHCHISDHHRE